MAGSMTEPIAMTVAGLEPEIVAKKAHASTEAMAIPPGIHPTRLLAKRMTREAILPSIKNWPERTKNGTAMMAKLSRPVNRRWEMMLTLSNEKEEKPSRKISTLMPRAMEVGVLEQDADDQEEGHGCVFPSSSAAAAMPWVWLSS